MQYDHTGQQKAVFTVIDPQATGNDSYSPNLKGFDEGAYLSAKALAGDEDAYKRNKFNQAVSDAIPINRAISDTRAYRWVSTGHDCWVALQGVVGGLQRVVGGPAGGGGWPCRGLWVALQGVVGGPAGGGGWPCRGWWVALQGVVGGLQGVVGGLQGVVGGGVHLSLPLPLCPSGAAQSSTMLFPFHLQVSSSLSTMKLGLLY